MEPLDALLDRIAAFVPVLLSLTVHEWAHAWTAWKLGDDTAKMLGRVSLNPIDHVDPVGTLLLPLLGIPFGWAKPVPINPNRFSHRVTMPVGTMLVAVAGPLSNVVLAALGCAAAAIWAFAVRQGIPVDALAARAFTQFLQMVVVINVILALFNLLPIPPLDGSRIVEALIPDRARPAWNRFGTLSPFILAAVILLPILGGFSLFAWPIRTVGQLLHTLTP